MKYEKINNSRIACYDMGDDSEVADRYTVVYVDYPVSPGNKRYNCVGMSALPFHPQGVGQHSMAMLGKHLGKRILFKDLPEDCQKLVNQDLA